MSEIANLTCSGRANPIGLGGEGVSFSWKIQSEENDVYQRSFRICVWDESGALAWDSGRIDGSGTIHIPYRGAPLCSREVYRYQVESELTSGAVLKSAPQHFEMGLLLQEDWQAKWIGREPVMTEQAVDYAAIDQGKIIRGMMAGEALDFTPDRKLEQINSFFRNFSLREGKAIQRARIYAAACGIYQIELNGQPVSDTRFAPGFTRYDKTIFYQTYDVTGLLRGGENRLRFLLADG